MQPYEQRYTLPDGPILDVEDGKRVVQHAFDRFSMDVDRANELLAAFGAADPIEVLPDGTVALDSAREWLYRPVGEDRWNRRLVLYERVQA